jgi:hypothetical protein
MNTIGSSPAARSHASGVNPFARALSEARGGTSMDQSQANKQSSDSLNAQDNQLNQPFNFEEQQQQLIEQQNRERLRQELHRKVNPVDQKDVFSAREQQVKEEINKIRHELRLLAQEVMAFQKDIDVTLMGEVVQPGQEGKYHLTFFQKLREFIMLLRKKIHSARTWATTLQGKKTKKNGLNFKAKGHSQTKNVWDTMHHERGLARAGG